MEARVVQRRRTLDAAYYVGAGKAKEVRELARSKSIDVIVADHDLSPAQVRNLEKAIGTKVVDRSELILDIFAGNAKTRQARLQVELAQLEYTLPRLKRMWTHLSRYEGGIGTRGPGETQLETDRRLARRRITDLRRKLHAIEERKRREVESRQDQFNICLVGYTNAGKSTLMNAISDAGVLVDSRLFSTLDTRTKSAEIEKDRVILISDTVGFIRHLPHHLVRSFHATLEEAVQADLLLHVVDAASPFAQEQMKEVRKVLKELECHSKPTLVVLNKMDKVQDHASLILLREEAGDHVCTSALTGTGLDELRHRIAQAADANLVRAEVFVEPTDGSLIGQIYAAGKVLLRTYADGKLRFEMVAERRNIARLRKIRPSLVVNISRTEQVVPA